jgi:hypothetical protein
MLHARLLTVRAGDSLRRPQSIMRAAFAGARFRMTTFWIWHSYSVILKFSISNLRFLSCALYFELCTLMFQVEPHFKVQSTKHKVPAFKTANL